MVRKIFVSAVLAGAVLASSGCHHKVQNPLANIDSKQPDKSLFDRSMDSMKKAHYQEARTLLETLINTYPDSEYIAGAGRCVVQRRRKSGVAAGGIGIQGFPDIFPQPAGSLRGAVEDCVHALS
jgi:hypothetical protein